MKNNGLNKFFVILVSILIITLPVAYAQQISFQTKDDVSGDYGGFEKPLGEGSAVVSELVINVSENGSFTVVGPPRITAEDSYFPAANAESTGEVAPQADGNTCSDAIALDLDTNYYAYVDYAGDIDWFKWNLPSSGKFTADVDVPSNRDYELKVYTSCSNEACSSTKGKGSDEKCETDPGSGWVYAKIWGYNNDYSKSDKYYIKGSFAASKQYDLSAIGFSVTPSSPTDKDSISVLYEVKNNGPDDITSYFNYKLYIDDQHKQTCNANSGLKAGFYGYCTRDGLSLSAGTHVLKLVADADGNIAETNENNNVKTEDLAVMHVLQYDLVPGDFTVTPSSPKDTDSIIVRYRATNNGPDDITSSFNYKLYIGGVHQQTCLSSGRTAGTTSYCDKDGIKLSAGQHTLKNVVDADNNVAETNENNNQLEQQLTVSSSCVDNDGDGYGSGCSSGSDCNDNDVNVNPGKSEVCNDGKDNNCDGLIDEGCCSDTQNPYYCGKTGSCWKKPQCDNAIVCGGQWWACNEPSRYNAKCVDTKPGCCEPQYPYYCPANNWCFGQDGFCDGRTVHTCSVKFFVCNKKADVGQCFGDTLRCCPPGESWWESDKQCHRSSEPQKCTVPDGSSANCDCDSDSDCSASSGKPYCGEGGSLYDVRTPQGFHACLSAKPKFCGDGKCGGSENYNNCQTDCGQLAPKGTINVDVYYSSGANANKPISGASVSLDGVQKGTTDSRGKLSLQASYGQRNVRVECPDNTFCGEKTVGVDGAESVSFGCGCNPSTDSDGDGYSNEDEVLLGTDPKDANRNFKTTFASDSVDLLACVPTPASFFILWKEYKKSGSIIQSHSLVVNSLNVTTVMGTSFEEKPYVVAAALAAADLDAEGAEVIVNPVNVTLESVMKKAEYVDGVRMQDGILIIATDKDGQTTALIAIGAGCVGAFTGSVYGIGQGLFDDIKGVIDGIWFVITHLGEVNKIWSGAKELVAGIAELGKNLDETFWSMFNGILGKGKSINLFREEGLNKPEPYRHFQVGFFYGFITGYLVEQVALGGAVLGYIAKTFKVGQLLGKAGKATKLMEKLAVIRGAEEFGAEIAEKLGKLKYLKEGIENWADNEIKGLARIVKHNEDWAKGLSEAEAKVASQKVTQLVESKLLGKIDDIADSKIKNLLDTNLGRETIKLSEATPELLAKQSKLIDSWGTKELNKVTKKNWLNPFDPDRVKGLKRVLDVAPDKEVAKLTTDRAVILISDTKLTAALKEFKGIEGFENVGQRLATSEPKSPMFEAKKALELKEKGKTVTRFDHELFKSDGSTLTDIDVTYVDGGVTKYVETSAFNWNKASKTEVDHLKEQLQHYIKHAGNDPSKVKFASEQRITSAVKQVLDDLGIELI